MTTTDSRRFALLCALGVILFFLYQAWQTDYASSAYTAPAAQAPDAPDTDVPGAALSSGDVPDAPAVAESAPTGAAPALGVDRRRVRVETDVLVAEIALAGGDLRRLELKGYPVSKAQPESHFPLLQDEPGRRFVVQSGLAGTPVTHESAFTSAQLAYAIPEGAAHVDVALEHADAGGLTARKVYRFTRGSYEVELVQTLANGSAAPVVASGYARFVRTLFDDGNESRFLVTFKGLGFYERKDNGKYRFVKSEFEDLHDEPVERRQQGGWIAFLQHYFVAAILPPGGQEHVLSAKPRGLEYKAQYQGPAVEVAPGAEANFATRLYLGPKLQKHIGKVAPGLELTVDYGILTVIAEPLFWLLDLFHQWSKNWGVAIILLTIVVKLAMYKLSEAQYRSMARMKKFGPRIQEIKERYGDDRERLNKAMMDLYKKEGFNPLAGCWPLLVQFPVFIALYWVLLESVELRQADFFLWWNDLSAPDPYFVLPILFGASMWLQQKMSGQTATMDPMQQKVMNAMPIMLTAFFAFFPMGLVLYWFVSNLIGIGQQWYITRKLEREAVHK